MEQFKKSDDDVLVYAVRGEKWRGTKSCTVSREVKGGRERKGQARKQDHGEGCESLAKDFDCIHELLNFLAVQKVAPLTS